MVPPHFSGTVLYPLNQLQDRFPDRYADQAKKYAGRAELREQRIPPLGCLWNDVLHLSPVHPGKIREALGRAGFETRPVDWFEIEPESAGLNRDNTVIYLSPQRERGNFSIRVEDFTPYHYDHLPSYGEVTAATRAYFEAAKQGGERPFLFNFMPHVLFRGTIETNILKRIRA